MGKNKSKALDRVPQHRYDPDELDMTKPLDLTKFGSDEDPCFGKLYDLNTKQCKLCADADFCAIKMAQSQSVNRKELNKQNDFIDEFEISDVKLDKTTKKKVKKFMLRRIEQGVKPILVRKKAIKKYSITKDQAKEIYKLIK